MVKNFPKFILAVLLNPFLIKIIHHLSITSHAGRLSTCGSVLEIGTNLIWFLIKIHYFEPAIWFQGLVADIQKAAEL